MSNKVTGTRFAIEWLGYNLPEGWPKVLCEMYVIGHSRVPDEIERFPHSLGGGYHQSIQHIGYPVTPLAPERLAVIRRQRLERRMQRQAPLFAAQLVADEMARRPDYYAGLTDVRIEAEKRLAIEHEWRQYNTMLELAGQLIVYAQEPEECTRRAKALWDEMAAVRARLAPTRVGEG